MHSPLEQGLASRKCSRAVWNNPFQMQLGGTVLLVSVGVFQDVEEFLLGWKFFNIH